MEGKNMQQGFAATTDWRAPTGVRREARECGNQQPIHVISSSSLQMALRSSVLSTKASQQVP